MNAINKQPGSTASLESSGSLTDWIRGSRYPRLAVVNFIILAVFGLVLRIMQIYPLPIVNYQFLLHAHSHFAFSGWIFFSMALLLTDLVWRGRQSAACNTVFLLTLVSALGMLVTFSFQGYRAASIFFSTLFILVTYRFTFLVLRERKLRGTQGKLIVSGLIFLCVSSLGPFSLAPLAIYGLRDSSLYQNSIYFYLHFQMNGFMLFTALGLFAASYLPQKTDKQGIRWLYTFIFSAIPLFLIFTLWTRPAGWVWGAALAGAIINMVSWFKLCGIFKQHGKKLPVLVKSALFAISLKVIFQVLICVPAVGEWTFLNRNLIIGYIHLLTLGCIVPLILDQFITKGYISGMKLVAATNLLYLGGVILYLAILFLQPVLLLFHLVFPYQYDFVWIAAGFVVIGGLYLSAAQPSRIIKK